MVETSHESAPGERGSGVAGSPVQLAVVGVDLAVARANRSMSSWTFSHANARGDGVVR